MITQKLKNRKTETTGNPPANLFEKNRGKLVRCCQTLSHSSMGIRDPLASLQEPGKLRDNTQSKRHGEENIGGKTVCGFYFSFLPACNGRIDATQSGTNLNDNNPPGSLTNQK
jgi:hypothetical protein